MASRLRSGAFWVVAALVAGGGYYAFQRFGGGKDDGALRYETASVDRGRIVSKITATGTLSALVTVQVGSQVSGRVQEILVDFNSPVKKGQVIARLDPQFFHAALEQAKANALAARANLARAEVQAREADRQFQRARTLTDQKLVAEAEAETAQSSAEAQAAQVAAARAAVQQATASLNQAKVNLEYTTVLSPIDGIVISRNVDVGQTVAASLQAPILFVIAEDLRKMQVDASVSEADVGRLRPGMDASFTVDAFPGRRFKGTVRQIRNASQTVQNVVTYTAVIDVANPELELRPGMTASVTFVQAERDDVLRVPNAALRFRPTAAIAAKLRGLPPPGPNARDAPSPRGEDPARRSVWVQRGLRAEPVSIRVGLSDGTSSELVEGALRDGDVLLTDAVDKNAPPAGSGRGPRFF